VANATTAEVQPKGVVFAPHIGVNSTFVGRRGASVALSAWSPRTARAVSHAGGATLASLTAAGEVAQLVEHTTENRGVGSSILPLAIAQTSG
jgi:hypothetical protein